MPTFAPKPIARPQLMGLSPLIYYHRPKRRLAGLGYLAQDISPVAIGTGSEQTYESGAIPTDVFEAPAPPAGWDTGETSVSNAPVGYTAPAPPSTVNPAVPAAAAGTTGPITIQPGTTLTYSITYSLPVLSDFFTSNDDALAAVAQMLAGAGLQVLNTQTPIVVVPGMNLSAVLTLQATQGFVSLQQIQGLCDNAFTGGAGAQIAGSSIQVGSSSATLEWLEQNWALLAAGLVALIVVPKLL